MSELKEKDEQPRPKSLEERLEALVVDQLTRYTESSKADVMLLYLIHKDLQALLQELRVRGADASRKKAGF